MWSRPWSDGSKQEVQSQPSRSKESKGLLIQRFFFFIVFINYQDNSKEYLCYVCLLNHYKMYSYVCITERIPENEHHNDFVLYMSHPKPTPFPEVSRP